MRADLEYLRSDFVCTSDKLGDPPVFCLSLGDNLRRIKKVYPIRTDAKVVTGVAEKEVEEELGKKLETSEDNVTIPGMITPLMVRRRIFYTRYMRRRVKVVNELEIMKDYIPLLITIILDILKILTLL